MVILAGRRQFLSREDPGAEPRPLAEWASIAAVGRNLGSENARVTIVEFSDFQCPFCAKMETVLRRLRVDYPTQLRISYLHFPLTSIHPMAYQAAVAAECAGAQGKFEAYHDVLFQHRDSLGKLGWDEFATRVQVPDISQFRACVKSDGPREAIERDVVLGKDLSLLGTPAFIIDGTLYPAGMTEEELDARVRAVVTRH
jgi:protein-disulfide isomerase